MTENKPKIKTSKPQSSGMPVVSGDTPNGDKSDENSAD